MGRIRECQDDIIERELSNRVIGAFYDVYNKLGYGFLESVYQAAFGRELARRGFHIATEVKTDVYYDGEPVGAFRIDLLVESRLVCELKAGPRLASADEAQLLNLLRATDLELGLLFHFGPKPSFKRLVASNAFKKQNSRRFAASASFAAPRSSEPPRKSGTPSGSEAPCRSPAVPPFPASTSLTP